MKPELDENKVWIDGCFDFTHHGHSGAILQARQTIVEGENGELYCGVHDDEAIAYNKGSIPVMNSEERYEHTRANRWCSYVVEKAPYVTQPEWMDKYHCKYVVHGDDITLDANGEDCYQLMKDLGRFREVKRTNGVSTTEIIQRILTKSLNRCTKLPSVMELEQYSTAADGRQSHCFVFNENLDNILVKGGYQWNKQLEGYTFIKGDFDLFHIGHIEQLGKLKADSQTKQLIAIITTSNDCVMTLKERSLSLLSCKYVDGLLFCSQDDPSKLPPHYLLDDPELTRGAKFSYLTRDVIIKRIEHQTEMYMKRNVKKGMSFAP